MSTQSDNEIEQSMKLPEGRTCADCKWIARCKVLIDCDESNTECDWAPSRFQGIR